MKQLILYLLLVPYGINIYASEKKPLYKDDQKIKELTVDYVNLLQKTINSKSDAYLGEMDLIFNDFLISEHIKDITKESTAAIIYDYFSIAKNQSSLDEIDTNSLDAEILDCTFSDPKTSQTFAYVKLPKLYYWNDGKKTNVSEHILCINITNSNYKIENVYDYTKNSNNKFSLPCANSKSNNTNTHKLNTTVNLLYDEVTELYKQQSYIDALIIVKEILALNSKFMKAIDAKEALIKLITLEIIQKEIDLALQNQKISKAQNIINIVKKQNLSSPNNISMWVQQVEETKTFILQNLDFEKAEYYFNKELFQLALPIYLELKGANFKKNNLESRIISCKEADPLLIKKRIQTAYNKAVDSRKHHEETFKIYYKYENTEYLKGTNYHFMCLMMIGKGNKSLLKELSITPNQADNMAVNYFYKARRMGINNKDIEFMIFTKNYNKKSK